MNIYNAWCDLKPGAGDTAFADGVTSYMDHLRGQGLIERWRLSGPKLGLGLQDLGEFHLTMEARDLPQLACAFKLLATPSEPVEGFHFGVNALVQNTRFAHYRDFPDPERQLGMERP